MPVYEFKCRVCDKRFELLIGFSRIDEAKCVECGSGDVARLISTFAARMGGGGSSSGCAGCASGNCGSCGCGH